MLLHILPKRDLLVLYTVKSSNFIVVWDVQQPDLQRLLWTTWALPELLHRQSPWGRSLEGKWGLLCFTPTPSNVNDTGKQICSLNYLHPYGGAGEAELRDAQTDIEK